MTYRHAECLELRDLLLDHGVEGAADVGRHAAHAQLLRGACGVAAQRRRRGAAVSDVDGGRVGTDGCTIEWRGP